MTFYPEFNHLSLDQLTEVFKGDPVGEIDDPMTFYPDVAIRIAKCGEKGLEFLESTLTDQNPDRVAAAVIGLGRAPDSARIEEKIVQLLEDKRDAVIAEAIVFLMAKNKTNYLDKILSLMQHSSPIVASAVLGYMAKLFPDQALPLLKNGLKHEDPLIRWSACDGFDEIGRREAEDYLKPLLKDPDEDVRTKAAQTIHFLQTGKYDY